MTDLRHYRNPVTGYLTSDPNPIKATGLEPIIPIPASLVTDQLLVDLEDVLNPARARRNLRLRALRDALIAGRPKPEPLAEPTDPAARVVNAANRQMARLSDGRWVSADCAYDNWEHATEVVGPLRLADGAS